MRVKNYMQQIFAAIHYMHRKGVVNRYAQLFAGKTACIDSSPATMVLSQNTLDFGFALVILWQGQ